jgi:hypothetical protein
MNALNDKKPFTAKQKYAYTHLHFLLIFRQEKLKIKTNDSLALAKTMRLCG